MSERDDFRIFDDHRHMLFGLTEPFGVFRSEVEGALRRQVPDTVVEAIAAYDEPKFLTIARKTDDPSTVIVTSYGVCFRARLEVSSDGGASREHLDAALTYLFRDIDGPSSRSQFYIDLHADADAAFDAEAFKRRFLAFRYGD